MNAYRLKTRSGGWYDLDEYEYKNLVELLRLLNGTGNFHIVTFKPVTGGKVTIPIQSIDHIFATE